MKRSSEILEHYKNENAKMKIMVIMGGFSSEREISLVSGKAVFEGLKRCGKYEVILVDLGNDVANVIAGEKPDFVFNAMHGLHGEDGCLQGMLEIMGLPYSHSGVFASAICMNKLASKELLKNAGIKCPQGLVISKELNLQKEPIARPFVIKPVSEGSSIGVEIVFEQDDFDIANYDFKYGDYIIEEYIPGREIHVAVLDDEAIGAVEILPEGKFYDFETKYTAGKAKHVMPAPLKQEDYDQALQLATDAHRALKCEGVSRVDFRFNDKTGEFFVLEVNTHPGMTNLSLVPEIAAYVGIDFDGLLEKIIQEGLIKFNKSSN